MAERDLDDLSAILARSRLFSALDDTARAAVGAAMRPCSYTAGQAIFGRGDPGRDLYVVRDGRVKISILTAEGRELSFTHINPGDTFGEIAMLDGGLRTADATALSDVQAMSLSQTAMRDLMREHPDICTCVITFLCARLRETDLAFEGVALHRIEVRLARYLDSLCRQVAPDQDEGTVEVRLAISQGELALLLGASRPKVNGALALLEADGAIRRKGDMLSCQLEDLRAIGEID